MIINDKVALCEQVDISTIDPGLLMSVRSSQGQDWTTLIPSIIAYRKQLLDLQNWRCAYCQIPIMSDENGIRELDHILPKNPSKTRTQNKRVSSAYKDRRHTNGYSAFTYEPLNLVITCKQCNTYKGLFDPLRNRHLPIQSYPISADAFDSIHPHFHRYSQHINIFQGWIYEGVTSQGKFLIGCCKLDEAEVLARRKLATAYTAQSINLIDCLWKFVGARHALTIPECAASISDTFKIPYNEAFHLVSVWFLEETMTEGFTRALDAAKPYINNQKRH